MSKRRNTHAQPWAVLYNLESQLEPQVAQTKRRVGRPRNPIPRVRVTAMLTADERRLLRQLTNRLQEQLDTSHVTQGQIVGLSLRMLERMLESAALPEAADGADWPALVAALAPFAENGDG